MSFTDLFPNKIFQAFTIGIISFILIYWYGGHTSGDDTFIYMRYVQNFLDGNNFVYNIGEKSFGTTSLLWAYFMIPLAYIFSNTIVLWKIVSTLIIALRISILFIFFRHIKLNTFHSLLLTIFCSLDIHLIRWSSSGMENSLAIFSLTILLITFYLFLHNDNVVKKYQNFFLTQLALLVGLLPYIRPELALYSIGICLIVLIDKNLKKYSIKIITISAFIFILMLISNIIFFESFIPQTAQAKEIMLYSGLGYALRQSLLILITGSVGGLITILLVKNTSSATKKILLLIFLSIAVTIIYLAIKGQLVSTRYSFFLASPILLGGALVISEFFARMKKSIVPIFSFAVQLFLTTSIAVLLFPITRVGEENDIRKVVEFSRIKLQSNSRVAISEIGVFGFYSNYYIIDLYGLTDRETLKWARSNGRVETQEKLEDLLIFRNASHYIECFGQGELIKGQKLNFEFLAKFPVRRNNFSKLEVSTDYWQVYELTKNNSLIK